MVYIACSKCGSTRLERSRCSDFICLDCGSAMDLPTVVWGQVDIEFKMKALGVFPSMTLPKESLKQPCK